MNRSFIIIYIFVSLLLGMLTSGIAYNIAATHTILSFALDGVSTSWIIISLMYLYSLIRMDQ